MGDARRIKKVRNLNNALTKLVGLTPVQYKNADNDPDFQTGFIAQDFAKVFPDYVSRSGKDNGSDTLPPEDFSKPALNRGWRVLALDVLVPWIVGAIKELSDDLDQLKKKTAKRVQEVDAKVAAFEARIAALEAAVPVNQQKIAAVEDRVTVLEKKNETLP
ncbi:MAG TPA: tail fiber domain-containing protein [Oligoflexus sp.]|uniref:tail fiber domain-containing protein n=1 Tax=Oligoflexus sp. TaxID=1971216 RepID=UPI002D6FB10E|nr:tail fiber domain-containing protein [Oligoflexus sp.]HYX39927.1 tail fiber domain-containing protein [Oligoflexus sp.]